GSDRVSNRLADVTSLRRGCGEMMCKLGEVRLGTRRVQRLQHVSHLPVEPQAACRRQIFVQRIADKRMREEVAPALRLSNDTSPNRFIENFKQPLSREFAHAFKHVDAEFPPDHSSDTEEAVALRRQKVQATDNRSPNAFGDCCAPGSDALSVFERSLLMEKPDDFHHEKRIAVRPPVYCLH